MMSIGDEPAKGLHLSMSVLPDLRSVGGNVHVGHPMQRYRQERADKERWRLAIREALGPPPYPRFERARMHVTVYYQDRRRRDKANIIRATKHLTDALVEWGILADDDVAHLDDSYSIALGSELGPLTIVLITDARPASTETPPLG